MERYEVKTCACCNRKNMFLSDEYKKNIDQDIKKLNEGAYLFHQLWNTPLDHCNDCGYVSDKIEVADSEEKKRLLQGGYKKIKEEYKKLKIDSSLLERAEEGAIYSYLNKDELRSAIGDIIEYNYLTRSAVEWYHENEGEDNKKIYDNALKIAQKSLKSAEKKLVHYMTQNSSPKAKFLTIYVYMQEKEINKAREIFNHINKEIFTLEYKKIYEYVEKSFI